ncbi:hypothetical protein JZO70_12640 [Enterococcus sp. 669A]|uniref:Uncharacterized protein n=1 Tax=Candidatus Enterococcus moelleringii TaxID=2815325 RepID=A0ABS3LBL5_9ENTE|nr:hypothetical protein [Enterococcus sp. 669A]MBO1307016.1 hypothetical protein [Enterococcus sp. 669A]
MMLHLSKHYIFKAIAFRKIRLAEDWLLLKDVASRHQFYSLDNITALLMLPFGFGTLIVRDWGIVLANRTPLKYLEEYCRVHRLLRPDLETLSDGRVSLILSEFALFQLNDAIWLNPLTIHHLYKQGKNCWIQLSNGLGLEVAGSKEMVIQLASQAAYQLALRRGNGTRELAPVDYFRLPAVFFGASLQDTFLLSQWLSSPGNYLSPYHLECSWELARQKSSSALFSV